jgi:hypothetical protein
MVIAVEPVAKTWMSIYARGLVGEQNVSHAGTGRHLNIEEKRIVRPHCGAAAQYVCTADAARGGHRHEGRHYRRRGSSRDVLMQFLHRHFSFEAC